MVQLLRTYSSKDIERLQKKINTFSFEGGWQ